MALRLRWLRLRQFLRPPPVVRVGQPGPVASLEDVCETSSLLISVSLPSVFLAGLGIFLPARSTTDQSNPSHFRNDLLTGEIEIFQNGTDHPGPVGQKIWRKKFQISQERESICDILTFNFQSTRRSGTKLGGLWTHFQ